MKETETEDKAAQLLAYYEARLSEAALTYVKTGRSADRMVALRLAGKVEVLKQLTET